jgi:hypothetical protein
MDDEIFTGKRNNFWWKVIHSLPYHGEDIVEKRYIRAESTEGVIDILKTHIHPNRVMFDLHSILFEVVDESQIEEHLVWTYECDKGQVLRKKLVAMSLDWQETFGIAPAVTTAISEYDAAMLVGCSFEEYVQSVRNNSAVTKGYDFIYSGLRYQVKACRPSGKKGSKITKVPQARNYEWDKLVWVMYDEKYEVQEAWLWDVAAYQEAFDGMNRISPEHMRAGSRLH